MRLLEKGEVVIIEGSRLIADTPNAGQAIVSHAVGCYKSRTFGGALFGFAAWPSLLHFNGRMIPLEAGQYFAVPTPATLDTSSAFVVEVENYKPLTTIGGPAESKGRLKYIDGCTDTLLIAPPKLGDPCFNLLHFPKHVRQTMHTHPSLRCGMTVFGRGRAIFPDGEVPLEPGSVWFLETNGEHAFHTDDSELLVTAWHPDSDFGPTDFDHPMLNRTIVNGVSAKYIDEIKTK